MDLTSISEVVGLASTAVNATGKATETIQKIQGMLRKGKPPEASELERVVSELAAQLTAANLMNAQLSDAMVVLRQEVRQLEEFELERSRYELVQTPLGDMVYRLRADAAKGEPEHYVCPVCLRNEKTINFITGDAYYKTCQKDRTHLFRFREEPPLDANPNTLY
ncbi:hypothetical protein HKCCE3408_05130 [Rhodobacterales bacterium HKCCE3408]|nr:hypothetical protein [Rhodobacterales bacterium HKCCE3408]